MGQGKGRRGRWVLTQRDLAVAAVTSLLVFLAARVWGWY